jgi:hypothetical protein
VQAAGICGETRAQPTKSAAPDSGSPFGSCGHVEEKRRLTPSAPRLRRAHFVPARAPTAALAKSSVACGDLAPRAYHSPVMGSAIGRAELVPSPSSRCGENAAAISWHVKVVDAPFAAGLVLREEDTGEHHPRIHGGCARCHERCFRFSATPTNPSSRQISAVHRVNLR